MTGAKKTIVLAGALDTKAAEFALVKALLEKQGMRALLVDIGILGQAGIAPDVSREAVAEAAGVDLEALRRGEEREKALKAMGRGLAVVARRLYDEGQLDGILGMGGSGGTTIATAGMRALPLGLPKLMVSTLASGDVRAFVGAADIVMMPSIVDVAGINRISARVYANAAAAITGMVQAETPAIAGRESTGGRLDVRQYDGTALIMPAVSSSARAAKCSCSTRPASAARRWRRSSAKVISPLHWISP